jgi:hypothetical protein
MDEKLKMMLIAQARTRLKECFADEGLAMADWVFSETDLSDDLDVIFTRFMKDRNDDREYDRLERGSKSVVEAEFHRVKTAINQAKAIIESALRG